MFKKIIILVLILVLSWLFYSVAKKDTVTSAQQDDFVYFDTESGIEIIIKNSDLSVHDETDIMQGWKNIRLNTHTIEREQIERLPLLVEIGIFDLSKGAADYTKDNTNIRIINGREFYVLDGNRECSGDVFGCQYIGYITKFDSDINIQFNVWYSVKNDIVDNSSPEEEEELIAAIKIREIE